MIKSRSFTDGNPLIVLMGMQYAWARMVLTSIRRNMTGHSVPYVAHFLPYPSDISTAEYSVVFGPTLCSRFRKITVTTDRFLGQGSLLLRLRRACAHAHLYVFPRVVTDDVAMLNRGRTLGGSSAINFFAWVKPPKGEVDGTSTYWFRFCTTRS